MARVNIDDEHLADDDYRDFEVLVGDRDVALGAYVRAKRKAQDYYCKGQLRLPIPFDKWKKHGFRDELVESGLFIKVEDGYRYADSEDEFAWYLAKFKNGKKGGRGKRKTETNISFSGQNLKQNQETENISRKASSDSENPPFRSDTVTVTATDTVADHTSDKLNPDFEITADPMMVVNYYNQIIGRDLGNTVKESVLNGGKGDEDYDNFMESCEWRPTTQSWKDLFQEIRKMPFLMGQESSDWCVSLFWIITPDNLKKIQKGQYRKATNSIPGQTGGIVPINLGGVG